jgi:hypothetical protein
VLPESSKGGALEVAAVGNESSLFTYSTHLTLHLREMKYSLEAVRDPMPIVMRVPDSQCKTGDLRASVSYTLAGRSPGLGI